MKRFLFLMLLVFIYSTSYSQYYYLPILNANQNPGNLNNDSESTVGNGLAEDWEIIIGPNNSTPIWSDVQEIPFEFSFNGEMVEEFIVSTTGILTFNTSTTDVPSVNNLNLPSSEIPDNAVCIWGITGTGSNDHIVKKTFGDAPNRQHWVFFNSYSIPGTDAWSYWSIVLEESTNKIYIVDMRTRDDNQTSLTLGIQLDETTATEVVGSPNIDNLSGDNGNSGDNVYYEFIYGTQPSYDMFTYEILSENFYNVNEGPFTIEAVVKNFGSETINSYDINYQINGGDIITESISGENIIVYETDQVVLTTSFNPTEAGAYEILCWPSNLNGNEDEVPENDQLSRFVSVVENPGQKLPLHEVFTSSTCGPCVGGNETLKEIFNANPDKYTCIKYQMSWPGSGDPYYTAEGGVRKDYYGVNAVPNMFVNGGYENVTPYSYTQTAFDEFYGQPAYMDIQGHHIISGTDIEATMMITPHQDYPWDDLYAHIVVIEKLTTENVGSNGETEFEYVMMKMLPDAFGTQVGPLEAGENNFFTLTANLEDTNIEEFDDLEVVLFVERKSTHEVFQSSWSTESAVDVNTISNHTNYRLYPNPAITSLKIEGVQDAFITISTISGQILINEYNTQEIYDLDCSTLKSGVYMVQINTMEQSVTKKFIIKR